MRAKIRDYPAETEKISSRFFWAVSSGRFCFAKSGFIAAIILAMIHPAQAVMVKYIDEFGKMHYADTDYTNVPEKYYYQVRIR